MNAEARTVGSYVYGIVRAEGVRAGDLASAPAVDPRRTPRVVVEGGVAAIVSDVLLDEFGEGALSARLEDPLWLEHTARAHEDVLERALSVTDVLPFRFCTLYRSDDDVHSYLASSGAALEALLEQVSGTVELGVRGFLAAGRLDAVLDARIGNGQTKSSSAGKAYLVARQRERRVAEERARFTRELAEAVHRRLASAALDARPGSLLPATAALDAREPFWSGAYLVSRDDSAFRREIDELAAQHADLEVSFDVTGPWPPYNFVPREVERA